MSYETDPRDLLAMCAGFGAARMWYSDAAGELTERVIEPVGVRGRLLVAYCHARGEQRSFRADRVVSFEPMLAPARAH